MFPEGLLLSLEKTISNFKKSVLFELTNCFLNGYDDKKERTHQQKANKSVFVPEAGVEPARFPTGV